MKKLLVLLAFLPCLGFAQKLVITKPNLSIYSKIGYSSPTKWANESGFSSNLATFSKFTLGANVGVVYPQWQGNRNEVHFTGGVKLSYLLDSKNSLQPTLYTKTKYDFNKNWVQETGLAIQLYKNEDWSAGANLGVLNNFNREKSRWTVGITIARKF